MVCTEDNRRRQVSLRTLGFCAACLLMTSTFLPAQTLRESESGDVRQSRSVGEPTPVDVPEDHMVLEHIIRRALQFHPEIAARREALDSALAERDASTAGYLPSADITGTLGGEFQTEDDRDLYGIGQAELSVTQTLYNGNRTRHEVSNRGNAALVRYYELKQATSQVALNVISAYEDNERYRRLVELNQETYLLNRRVLDQISRRVENGTAARVELEQMDGSRALAESNLLVEAANLHDVTQRYQRLVGELPPERIERAVYRERLMPGEREELLEQTYRYNPELKAAMANVSVAQARERVTRAARSPQLLLRGRQNLSHNVSGFDSRDTDLGSRSTIELVLSYNLFQGGRAQAQQRSSAARAAEARHLRLDACLDVRQDALVAYNDSRRLLDQAPYLTRHQGAMDQVRNAYRDQFDIGQRTLLEILDIEAEYQDASRARINGEHDLTLARAQTLHEMGLLLEEMSIDHYLLPSLDQLGVNVPPLDGIAACQGLEESNDYSIESLTEGLEFDLPSQLQVAEPDLVLESSTSFPVGSTELSDGGRRVLQNFADQLMSMSELESVVVVGHTDSTGPATLNQRLSQARAESARVYLVAAGVSPDLIEAEGRGASEPIVNNDTEEGRQANRRFEITVVGRD